MKWHWWQKLHFIMTAKSYGNHRPSIRALAPSTLSFFRLTNNSARWSSAAGHTMVSRSIYCTMSSERTRRTSFRSESIYATTTAVLNGISCQCQLAEMSRHIHAVQSLILTSHLISRSDARLCSTASTWLYHVLVSVSSPCWRFIYHLIAEKKSHSVSAFCFHWLSSFCFWPSWFHQRR